MNLRPGITVCIPTIPPRLLKLRRAVESVLGQTLVAGRISIVSDQAKLGAPATRDRTWQAADTEWCAFLDDDDELLSPHLERLYEHARATGADLVYPWYTVVGGHDPHARWEGVPWDDAKPRQTTITTLVRTGLLAEIGGFNADWDESQGTDPGVDPLGNRAGEDYRMVLRAVAAGARIVHLPERTWVWYHHSNNTSGLPSRW